MNPTMTGILVQVLLAFLQVAVGIKFIYHWQRNSWRFTNIMKIREPLARAYCSLSTVVRARSRMAEDAADTVKVDHDRARAHHYLNAAYDEIVNFSVEHFKARFWMSAGENRQLDELFTQLRETWKLLRNPTEESDALLNDLRKEILRFDDLCGLKNYHGGTWTHIAFER
jgi:hypothetical protein